MSRLKRKLEELEGLPIGVILGSAVILLVLGGGFAWWEVRRPPTTDVFCAQRYAEARTAADSAVVDATVPPNRVRRPTSCGVMRRQSDRS